MFRPLLPAGLRLELGYMLRAGYLVLALGALVMTQSALGVGDFAAAARPALASSGLPQQAACEKLEPQNVGPDQISFRLLEGRAPLPSRPTLPFVFDEVCRIIEIPRLPVIVSLAGSRDGKAPFSVDDQLEIGIKPMPLNGCPGPKGCISWNFAEGLDPVGEGSVVRALPPQDLRALFSRAGTYEVTVRVVDLYKGFQSNSHIDLFVQLAPVPIPISDGRGGEAGIAALALFVVIGVVVGILIKQASRGSGPEFEEGT